MCSAGTIAPGTIAKAKGDAVAEDEVIAQIETDKVTIDVRAPTAGVITELMVSGLRRDCCRQTPGLLRNLARRSLQAHDRAGRTFACFHAVN